MNPDTVGRLNSAGVLLRFITPIMSLLILVLLNHFIGRIDYLSERLDNHIEHDVAQMKSDIAVIKAHLDHE